MAQEDYEAPTWVYGGQEVFAPYHPGTPYNPRGTAILCVVLKAAGYHALVENEKHRFKQWIDISELRIKKAMVH